MDVEATDTMPSLIVYVQVKNVWRVSLALRLLRVAAWLMRGKLMISTQDGITIFEPK
jgi:hypothetical protein